jgi:hypothetical protein
MKVRVLAAASATSLLLVVADAPAVINHPIDDPTPVAGPAGAVIGRWGANASAVAIDPNYILTTRHQGGGVGTTVVFNGINYEVAQEIVVGTADLRIARITTPGGGSPANLGAFTPIYSGSDAAPLSFTLAGYGRGRGATLTTTGGTYGYAWNTDGNTNLRFGRNVIDGSDTDSGVILGSIPVTTDVLFADFDGPGRPTTLTSEAILTEFDSGGGWFVENGPGNWEVAALSRAVAHVGDNADNPNTPGLPADPQPFNQALFASFQNAATDAPDYLDGVRLSSYRSFINASIPEPGSALILASIGALTAMRRRRR